jgi:alkanesulfonate monooxygenase SsuD/methylene tetrahydromethanopterin reductase-like flavin-dependent oxidoreductase (luciferase family)
MRDFRFSFNIFGITTRQAFVDTCRAGEQHGYDAVFAADHLGLPAPFPLLVTAAEATERMRVGILVLNAAFWNPALLAREVATTDILTDGRLEVGLGAGHMKWEFEAAGLEWSPFAARAERLDRTVTELGRFFASDLEQVTVTGDRRAAAEELAAEHRRIIAERDVTDPSALLSADELLQTPYHLIGTADEIAAQLRAGRERWGFSFITVHEPFMPTFAPVIERLRG